MDKKQISLINKAFDCLYDLNSKYDLFNNEKNKIENFMLKKGYKVKINSFDKCIFIKISEKEILKNIEVEI